MAHTIICEDCGHQRSNAQYANTKYCERCRLLRNLNFVGARTRTCALVGCSTKYAPVGRGDDHCAEHAFGANATGRCNVCKHDAAELHRASIRICKSCLRKPELRHKLVADLRASQQRRRADNQRGA